jgi:hypothetical protein
VRGRSQALDVAFVAPRVLLAASLGWLLAVQSSPAHALRFMVASLALLALLLLHTWAGTRIGLGAPARIVTFAWLAAFKYLPANLASAGVLDALRLCLILFVFYGGGRVLEYALEKHRARSEPGLVAINPAWFFAALPLAVAFTGALAFLPLLPCLLVIGSHHACAIGLRLCTRPEHAYAQDRSVHVQS